MTSSANIPRIDILNRQVLSNVKFLITRISSYRAFCMFTGIGERTVRQWYVTNPKAFPTPAHLAKISTAFKISIHDLVKSDIRKMKRHDLKANYYIIQEYLIS